MKEDFYERLNRIEERILSPELRNNSGLGNEIGFYIFDYSPKCELEVRPYLERILKEIRLKIAHVNLFEVIVEYLKNQDMLDAAVELQREQGDAELLSAFHGVIEGARIAPLIVDIAPPENHYAVIIT